jgi:hypothetical protein
MTKHSPFRYFKTSPEIIRLAVMLYVRFSLSLRNVEDLLHERGIEISHETVRFWWNRFGLMFAAEIRGRRVQAMRNCHHWRWHLNEVFVKINGEIHISPFEGESGPCCASCGCEGYRNLPPSAAQSTSTLIKSVSSTTDQISS